MKRYEAYRPTKYEWLTEVPTHWQTRTMRSLTTVSSERRGNREATLLSVYREYGVIVKSSRDDNHNVESEDLSNYKWVRTGDLVMNKMKMWQGSLGVSEFDGIVSPAYIVCHINDENVNRRYLHMLLRSPCYKTYYNQFSYGIRVGQWDMHYEDFKGLEVALPPREEQDQIVRYLDWQVSKINRLIAAKRKEIALLKEQKQRKTTEVVVHGLKPNVPHKDTGIAWIRSIPAHWHCVALKRCATVKSGITLGKQYPVGTNLVSVPYLRVANVQDGFVNIETVTNLNVTPEEAAQYRLPRGCVLMTEGGDRDKLGRGCVWNGEIENCIHQNHIFAVTVNDKLLLNKWLEYVSACDIGRVYFDVTAIKTTNLACTNASKVMAFPIPLPPRDEQECIINELNRITSRFNNAREGLEKQIEYLQELRIRLISDVVTGQINVRGIKVPDDEYINDEITEEEFEEKSENNEEE